MRVWLMLAALGLGAGAGVAAADEGPAPAGASEPAAAAQPDVAALEARIADLERENGVLRQQWGQATLETDRLRRRADALERELGEARRRLEAYAEAAGGEGQQQAAAGGGAAQAAARTGGETAEGVGALRAENERLARENAELTQLAGLAPEGERVAGVAARLEERGGVVHATPQRLRVTGGSHADHYLTVSQPLDGSAGVVSIHGAFSGGVHRGSRELTLTPRGGEAVVLPVVDYEATVRQTGMAGRRRVDKGDERVDARLEPGALAALAGASGATGRLGTVTFELTRDQVALFKALALRLEGAGAEGP